MEDGDGTCVQADDRDGPGQGRQYGICNYLDAEASDRAVSDQGNDFLASDHAAISISMGVKIVNWRNGDRTHV